MRLSSPCLERGIYLLPDGRWYVSAVHDDSGRHAEHLGSGAGMLFGTRQTCGLRQEIRMLKEKVAIVTGAGSGISEKPRQSILPGREPRLSRWIGTQRPEQERWTASRTAVAWLGDSAMPMCRFQPGVEGMVGAALDRFGRLDILVNNAAIQRSSPSSSRDDRSRLGPHPTAST